MSRYFPADSDGARHQIFPGVGIRTVWGTGLMLSLVEMAARAHVAEHEHPHEQMGMVLEGRAEFVVGGKRRVLGPGDMYLIPGGVRHAVTALDAPVRALDVFNPPREEYK
jgi:quercetin dioxygenase-like cupin family protein